MVRKTLTPKELVRKLDELNWVKDKVTYKDFLMFGLDKKFKLRNFKINGQKFKRGQYYNIALSEGFAAGSLGTTSLIRLFLVDRNSFYDVGSSVREYRKVGVITLLR